jgi:2Fe-2S ferredoxin
MPKVTALIHPDLAPHGATFDTVETTSVCDALLNHGIEIEPACGKVGGCTTCHMVVTQGFEGLSVMADVVVEIPRYSTNHVKGEF